jgi:hypothetical protein
MPVLSIAYGDLVKYYGVLPGMFCVGLLVVKC